MCQHQAERGEVHGELGHLEFSRGRGDRLGGLLGDTTTHLTPGAFAG